MQNISVRKWLITTQLNPSCNLSLRQCNIEPFQRASKDQMRQMLSCRNWVVSWKQKQFRGSNLEIFRQAECLDVAAPNVNMRLIETASIWLLPRCRQTTGLARREDPLLYGYLEVAKFQSKRHYTLAYTKTFQVVFTGQQTKKLRYKVGCSEYNLHPTTWFGIYCGHGGNL